MANVGDTLVFTWGGVHNVYIAPSNSCNNLASGTDLGSSSPVRYTVQAEDEGGIVFACEVPGHCQAGMLLPVNVGQTSSNESAGTTSDPSCEDDNESCEAWADAGECEGNPDYMLENCAMACDACVEAATSAPTRKSTERPTKKPTESPREGPTTKPTMLRFILLALMAAAVHRAAQAWSRRWPRVHARVRTICPKRGSRS